MAQPATSSPIDASAAARGARFEALGARAAVSIRRSACLRLRLASATCGACAAVCPTQALRAGEQQFELSGNCTGCGRCQTVCPSSALAVEGFDDAPVTATAGALTIECWRTPAGSGTLRLPCLGGLTAARLLSLCAAAPETRVQLVDRGWCGACASGGSGTHPARAVVERAAAWLAEAGVPAALRPAFVAPAAAGPAPAPAPAAMDPMQQQGRARRGFFAALAQPARAPQPSACLPAHSEASSQRQQGLAALQALVARHGGRMPAALVHRLQAGSSCQGHRVCAAACPTGALVRWRDDAHQRMGIAFDNAHCIACGHCVEVCPEQALQLQMGGGAASAGRRALSTFEQRACPGCGTRFASRAEEEHTHCPRCRKSAGLARSAFQTLFGART